MIQSTAGRPVIFGEVLYDIFDEEKNAPEHRILGGAPFNVAWHLQGFGLQPLIITRIGDDSAGHSVQNAMQQWGMDTLLVQKDMVHPTGAVHVKLKNGSPTFSIQPKQAYDFPDGLTATAQLQMIETSLLYHGTLALRGSAARQALQVVSATIQKPIFLDINLRNPWWDRSLLDDCLQTATWLKLNSSEIQVFIPDFFARSEAEQSAALDHLCERYALDLIMLTLGEKGALLKVPAQSVRHTSVTPITVTDTVGAGDAFSAVAILGLLHQWPCDTLLQRAVDFAGQVCSIRGAISNDLELYQRMMQQWTADG